MAATEDLRPASPGNRTLNLLQCDNDSEQELHMYPEFSS